MFLTETAIDVRFRSLPSCAVLELLEGRRLMSGDAVIEWNGQLLDAVREQRTAPPYAARNMAMVHLAIFDAISALPGERGRQQNRAVERISAPAGVAQSAHDTLVALYPSLRSRFDAALAESLAAIPDGEAEDMGVAAGKAAAAAVLAAREDDGADDVVMYEPGHDPADWQPTPPGFAPALYPNWPDVTPFLVRAGSQFRPAAPPEITSDAFTQSFEEVRRLGAADSTSRTAEQTEIALFWSDGAGTVTPPGHWNEIAQVVAEQRDNSLRENARLFAMLNVALADAGIVAWDAKYAYDFCRPITAIRNAAADGNPDTEVDGSWTPLIATPPFPAYISGHSTFSAAAATVLAKFFKTDRVSFTTTSGGLPGVERSFESFSEAAEEAGMSRIYGGIHWSFDNTSGLKAGEKVGRWVFAHFEHEPSAKQGGQRGQERGVGFSVKRIEVVGGGLFEEEGRVLA